jgi:hypothetical protein
VASRKNSLLAGCTKSVKSSEREFESLVAREEHLILIIISPHTFALTVLLIFRAGRRAFLSVSHAHKIML